MGRYLDRTCIPLSATALSANVRGYMTRVHVDTSTRLPADMLIVLLIFALIRTLRGVPLASPSEPPDPFPALALCDTQSASVGIASGYPRGCVDIHGFVDIHHHAWGWECLLWKSRGEWVGKGSDALLMRTRTVRGLRYQCTHSRVGRPLLL
jgi:hypothetical protein